MLLPLDPAQRPVVQAAHLAATTLLTDDTALVFNVVGVRFDATLDGLGALLTLLGTSVIPGDHQQLIDAVNVRVAATISCARVQDQQPLLKAYSLFVMNMNVQAAEAEQRAEQKAAAQKVVADEIERQRSELQQWSAALDRRQQELDTRASELAEKEIELNRRSDDIDARAEQITRRESELGERRDKVNAAEQRIRDHRRAVRNGKKRTAAARRRKG